MSLTSTDFQALVAEVEEARAILARKDELNRDIQKAEKRLSKLQDEFESARLGVEAIEQRAAKAQADFEHEKNRYALDLATHKAGCESKKREIEDSVSAAYKRIEDEGAGFRSRHASERRKLEEDLKNLKAEHSSLAALIADFKKRISALG